MLAFVFGVFAPWALVGCAACFAISYALFFALGRVGRMQAARAVDRASRLNELVSTAVECAEGRLVSRFSPLVVFEAERAREDGRWRLPRPRLPAQARYAAIPLALLVLFCVLPWGSENRGRNEEEPTAEEILSGGGTGEAGEARSRRGVKRPRRVAMGLRRKKPRAVARDGGRRKPGGMRRASSSGGGKGAAGSEKRPGNPARTYGAADPPEPGGALPHGGGEGWTEQDKAELAAMIEVHPRYAGVIRRYFGEKER